MRNSAYASAATWLSLLFFLPRLNGLHPPRIQTFHVVAEFPHDHSAFTQGLEYGRACNDKSEQCEDIFWESTGLYGKSSVRQVSLASGRVLSQHDLDVRYFGEGLTRLNDTLYQITWQSGEGFKYTATEALKPLGSFNTGLRDGWGLTNDGQHLIVTDSSHIVSWVDPTTFKIIKTLEVKDGDAPVPWLNELEYIDGELWANVWQRECIARIDLATGQVTHWMMMHGLRDGLLTRPTTQKHLLDVLNGIAWDGQGRRLFVTGKQWPAIFEVEPRDFLPEHLPTLMHVRKKCNPHHRAS